MVVDHIGGETILTAMSGGNQWIVSGTGSCRVVVLGSAVGVYALARSVELYRDSALPSFLFGSATYGSLFGKVGLGPGRVLAFLCVAVLAYTAVTRLWVPLYRALGWLIIPLGQQSLCVYVAHLFVLVGIYNLAPLVMSRVSVEALNLLAQLAALVVCWVLVRSQFARSIVPRHGPHHTVG